MRDDDDLKKMIAAYFAAGKTIEKLPTAAAFGYEASTLPDEFQRWHPDQKLPQQPFGQKPKTRKPAKRKRAKAA